LFSRMSWPSSKRCPSSNSNTSYCKLLHWRRLHFLFMSSGNASSRYKYERMLTWCCLEFSRCCWSANLCNK